MIDRTAPESDSQFGGQRASHTERPGSGTGKPEHHSTAVSGKGVGIYVTGHASGWINHGRKDVCAGASPSQGSDPTVG